MPNMKANGFSLFAEHMRPSLEAKLNVQFNTFYEVIKAATPYWAKIDNEEKRQWKNRAKSYMRSDDYYARQRGVRIRKVSNVKTTKTKKTAEKNTLLSEDEDDFDLVGDGELENSREQDIFELPGPVQDIEGLGPAMISLSFSKKGASTYSTDSDRSGMDLCEGGLSKPTVSHNKYFYSNSQTSFSKDNNKKAVFKPNHSFYTNNNTRNGQARDDYSNPIMKTDARGDYGGYRPDPVPQYNYPGTAAQVRKTNFTMISVKMFRVYEGLRGLQHCVNSPAELGLVEFSLSEGITDTYWHVFGPEHLPSHIAQGVQIDADRSHGIPVSGCMYSDNNAEAVVRALFTRWNPDLLPEVDRRHAKSISTPMLCVEAERPTIVTTLQVLLSRMPANQQSQWAAPIRQLKTELMHVRDFLRVLAGQNRINLTSTRPLQILQTLNQCPEKVVTPFDFHPGTLCELHNKLQVSCCAVSTARKCCYLLFQVFCRHFHVQPTSKHFPDFEGQSFKDPNLRLSEKSLIQDPYIFLVNNNHRANNNIRCLVLDEKQEDVTAFDVVEKGGQISKVASQTSLCITVPESGAVQAHQPQPEKFTPLPIHSLFPNLQ